MTEANNRLPLLVEITHNGVTATFTMLEVHGEKMWYGTPATGKKRARASMVLLEDGTIIGGRAVLFYAAGGAFLPDIPDYLIRQTRNEISRGFLHFLSSTYTEEDYQEDRKQLIQRLLVRLAPVYCVVDGAMADWELEQLSAVSFPQDVYYACVAHGIRVHPDLEYLLRAKDSSLQSIKERLSGFHAVGAGDWDRFSTLGALTDGLTCREVSQLRSDGLHLQQAPRATPRK